MAIGTSLPPRAYTREILTAAFNWLQTQPDSVRTKATTPDALVGLYTRAQRFGSVAESEAPVSSQNFMSDLKNLAEGLKAFDGSKVQLSATEAAIAGPLAGASTSAPAAPVAPAPTHVAAPAAVATPAPVAAPAPSAPAMAAPQVLALTDLNERAIAMLQEVQLALNLSSESEAANMMISLAYKTLKTSLLT